MLPHEDDLEEDGESSMFCPKCGVELPANASFCTQCGEQVSATIALGNQQGSSKPDFPLSAELVEAAPAKKSGKPIAFAVIGSILIIAAVTVVLVTTGVIGGDNKSNDVAATPTSSAVEASSAQSDSEPLPERLSFSTGSETGTYYSFGNAIAEHANAHAGITITVNATSGSTDNLLDLESGAAELGFCQSDILDHAYHGSRSLAGNHDFQNVRVVACLYDEQIQVVSFNDNVKTIDDLRGKRVSIGVSGSGLYYNAIDVLYTYGINESDIAASYLSLADASSLLASGELDAAFTIAGAPTPSVAALIEKGAHLLSMDVVHAGTLSSKPYYSRSTIPAGAYSGQREDITTVAVSAVIVANASVSDEAVYRLVKDIFENSAQLSNVHEKYAELSLEKGASITDVPYHSGAARYFEEKGLAVPT